MLNYNSFVKNFSLMILIYSIIISISLNDPILIWFMLEINNFMFMFLLSSSKNKKMIFFYFFIQIISSMMLMFSLFMNLLLNLNNIFTFMMFLSLMIKLGVPPFHFWMIIFINYTSYFLMSILLTIQKIIPFYLLTLIPFNTWLMTYSIILCAIIPPIMSLNIFNIKKILTYSSINQSSWMIMLITMKKSLWFTFMLIYSFTLIVSMMLLKLNKMTHYSYINNYMNNNNNNLLYFFMMLNLASMPPFSLFYMKWMSIFIMMYNFFNLLIIILMMISSLIMTYIYINIINLSLFKEMYSTKLLTLKKFNLSYSINLNFSLTIYLMMFMLMLFLFIF